MKNLKLSSCYQKFFGIPKDGKVILNTNETEISSFIYTNKGICVFDKRTETLKLIYDLKDVLGCEYLYLNNELCAASKSGMVIVVNSQSKEVREVIFCKQGLKAMSWSPDQEIVIFVTECNTMVVMNCNFDVVTDYPEYRLGALSFGEYEFITCGWGRKETQFHGSEGKEAAKQKLNFDPPQNIDDLDKTISISWRGDSELFAVSFVGDTGRMFKIFNKEGILLYTADKINGLGTLLAWRPSGSWIAVPHTLPNKYTIALFEKNGLRHRELILPFKDNEEPVVGLTWNTDSDILAVETLRDEKSSVYLYTFCNYHWYLKQLLNFDEKISTLVWDIRVEEGKTLHVFLQNGLYLKYKWNWVVHRSFGDSNQNQSVVAVIDGNRFLLTDFRNNVTPPPMSSYTIKTEHYINFCGFIGNPREEEQHKVFVITADGTLAIYDLEFNFTPPKRKISSKLLCSVKLDGQDLGALISNNWFLLNNNSIISTSYADVTTLTVKRFDENSVETVSEITLDGIIGNIISHTASTILVQLLCGTVYLVKLHSNCQFEMCRIFCKLPEVFEQGECVLVNGSLKLASLLPNRNLYINDTKVASDVTSFYLTTKYLLFTLLSSIKFMRLEDNKIIDERNLERGGKVIVVIPKEYRVIIQMPRGNLETISPRVLFLDIVGELLDSHAYNQCMNLLRKQRINLNIIVDHNPKDFIENIDTFLNEISDANWLNLFLSELQNEDFTKTMYYSNYGRADREYPEGYSEINKLEFICKKMSDRMMEKNYNKYIIAIIIIYVKLNNLEKALEIIWNEKNLETMNNATIKERRTSDGALAYLSYLVDVNTLYNEALGMYNLRLVLFVANKTQKDPKEYIPFLNELKQLEENYRKFKIDEYLKRYEKAVQHIARCGAERLPECLEFVQKHGVYQKALTVFEGNEECYKKLALTYGDFLRAQGKHENASIMYERGGNLAQAISSAKHVLDWTRCLQLTNQLTNGDAQEMKNISDSLVLALQEKGQFEVASILLKKYVGDLNKSIECLLNGRMYIKAIFETKLESPDLLDSMVIPHLKEYSHNLSEVIEADRNLFLKYKIRLLKVRNERAKRNTKIVNDDGLDECDIVSNISSVASSTYTGFSRGSGKTTRSRKNRRKQERKLLSLKEGNPFEDIALIDALHNLVVKIVDQHLHINQICKALMEIPCDEEAKRIQIAYKQLLKIIKDSLDEIWIPELLTSQRLNAPSIDYAQLENEQRYAMISHLKRFKPEMNLPDWEHEILK